MAPSLAQPLINRALRAVRPVARHLPTDVLWRVPVVGVVEVDVAGRTTPVLMANDGSDHVASLLFWRGLDGWEPVTTRIFLGLVSPGSTVLDIGANTGLFSLLAATSHPTVRVHAVEPVARVASILKANLVLNGVENVTCHRAACGDSTGVQTLHVPVHERTPMMASLIAGWSSGPHLDEEVEGMTVDGLVAAVGATRVDVLKIDAEGSEDAVLRGAGATLRRDRPFLLCEVLDRRNLGPAVTDALAGQDYAAFTLGPEGPARCDEVRGGADDDERHNYLFVHRSRLAEIEPLLAA